MYTKEQIDKMRAEVATYPHAREGTLGFTLPHPTAVQAKVMLRDLESFSTLVGVPVEEIEARAQTLLEIYGRVAVVPGKPPQYFVLTDEEPDHRRTLA